MGAILISENVETGHKTVVPYDILLLIVDQLPKSDWKTLRLLSREFSKFATDLPFFNELWFSAHAEDIEVFQNVCAHPVWAKQVTTIIYDKTLFSDRPLRLVCISWRQGPSITDPNYETIINAHPGPIAYLQHAKAQVLAGVEQSSLLTNGLRRLPNVSRFWISGQFGGRWQPTGEVDYSKYRSPLARNWGSDWPEPDSWTAVYSEMVQSIFSSIADSKASITEFSNLQEEDARDWPSICYPAEAFTFETPLLKGVETAFSNITSLKLRLDIQERTGRKQFLPFSKLLRKAERLEKLCLVFDDLDIDRVEAPEAFEWQRNNELDLETLFGDTIFLRLQFLGLHGLYITAESMEEFLDKHRKSLRGLTLEVRYCPSLEDSGLVGMFSESLTNSVDEKTRFAGFLNELANGLVDGMKLVSNIYASATAMKYRRHLGGGIYLVDMGDIGYAEDGWTLDTRDGI